MGDVIGTAATDLQVDTVVNTNVDRLAAQLQSSSVEARHRALEMLEAVTPPQARQKLVDAINARIKLSCLLLPPDGVPERYSPAAARARSILLQARLQGGRSTGKRL